MAQPGSCPHCGYNLTPDVPIERDGWVLTLNETFFRGERCKITRQQAAILYSIAKTNGVAITALALVERVGYPDTDAKRPCGGVRVQVFRLRQKLPHVPFETIAGLGYRWTG